MIDSKDYTDNEITYFINIGGLELYKVRKQVIKTIEKLFKPHLPAHYSYTFKDIEGKTVLILTSPVQFIPDLVRMLCKRRMAIYEIRELEVDVTFLKLQQK